MLNINNDTGMSNSLPFTYEDSKPEIKFIMPEQGARIGGGKMVILGNGYEDHTIHSYQDDDDKKFKIDNDVNARVQFAKISSKDLPIEHKNAGRITAENASVELEVVFWFNMMVKKITIKFILKEGNDIYEHYI